MKVLQLAQSRVVLWATEAGSGHPPFEVSRAVEGPLLERCPSAPRCPDGRPEKALERHAPAAGECPYAFTQVGECVEHRNRRALEAALFRPHEAQLARRLLEAVGYRVEVEAVDPLEADAGRILRAHRPLSRRSEVRVLSAPFGGRLVLVRDGEREGGQRPAGGRS